jgi:hypothetical protein
VFFGPRSHSKWNIWDLYLAIEEAHGVRSGTNVQIHNGSPNIVNTRFVGVRRGENSSMSRLDDVVETISIPSFRVFTELAIIYAFITTAPWFKPLRLREGENC